MEIVAYKKYITFLTIILLLYGCDKSEKIDNDPPSDFDVEVVDITDTTATINWTQATDPEGSTVFYDVFLDGNKLVDNITELTFLLAELQENTAYNGKIIASDPVGNTTTKTFTFSTLENQYPGSFTVHVPDENPFYLRITWTESIDPEGGVVLYNVFLDDELMAEDLTALYYTFVELKGLTSYSGYVEAVDSSGKITTAHFSFTTLVKIYDDTLHLETQEEVETFGNSGYNIIDGNVILGSNYPTTTNISDLSSLESIFLVKGGLYIKRTICENLNGLQNVVLQDSYIELEIEDNTILTNLTGLESINQLNSVYIANNDSLIDLTGLDAVGSYVNMCNIVANNSLQSLSGLENIHQFGSLWVASNHSLQSLHGLDNTTMIATEIFITNNVSLTNLSGLGSLEIVNGLAYFTGLALENLNALSNFTSVGTLIIRDTQMLSDLSGLENLTSLENELKISTNNGLVSLAGIENVGFTTGASHNLFIINNQNLTNLDPLSNYTFESGKISIHENTSLNDLCGLTLLINEIDNFIDPQNFTENNAYNPTVQDMLDGNCAR